MSRAPLTDTEQLRVSPQTGVQGVSVLAATGGGLFLRIEKITGEVTAELMTREAAETLFEQMKAVLRCAPLDPWAGAAAGLARSERLHATSGCAVCTPIPALPTFDIDEPLIGRGHSEAELAGLL